MLNKLLLALCLIAPSAAWALPAPTDQLVLELLTSGKLADLTSQAVAQNQDAGPFASSFETLSIERVSLVTASPALQSELIEKCGVGVAASRSAGILRVTLASEGNTTTRYFGTAGGNEPLELCD